MVGQVWICGQGGRVIHYLADFAEAFLILFGAFFDVLAGGVVALGMFLVLAWATIPHITKRV